MVKKSIILIIIVFLCILLFNCSSPGTTTSSGGDGLDNADPRQYYEDPRYIGTVKDPFEPKAISQLSEPYLGITKFKVEEYDEQNNLREIEEYEFNNNGKLIKSSYKEINDPDSNSNTVYSYDAEGKLIEAICNWPNVSDSEKRIYQYDTYDRLIKINEYDNSDSIKEVTSFNYDTSGKLLKKKLEEYYDSMLTSTTEYTFEYDSSNKLIKQIWKDINDPFDTGVQKEYEYDSSGRCTKIITDYDIDLVIDKIKSYVYDQSGKIIFHTYEEPADPQDYEELSYKYDLDDKWIQLISRYPNNIGNGYDRYFSYEY